MLPTRIGCFAGRGQHAPLAAGENAKHFGGTTAQQRVERAIFVSAAMRLLMALVSANNRLIAAS